MPRTTAFAQFSHATNQGFFVSALFLLRLALGGLFLWSGWSKMSIPDWSASAFLTHATGPFAGWFQSLAGNPVVDGLNMYGMLAIGIALILGFLFRPAAFCGIVLMILYYFANFDTNTAHGFIDEHLIYAMVFLVFLAGGVGSVWGLNSLIARQPSLQGSRWVKWLFS